MTEVTSRVANIARVTRTFQITLYFSVFSFKQKIKERAHFTLSLFSPCKGRITTRKFACSSSHRKESADRGIFSIVRPLKGLQSL